MKNCISTLLLTLFSIQGFSQDLRFEVRGRYTRPVKKEMLNEVRFIRDFVPGYPTNWITDYASAEISATCRGKLLKAASANDRLSAEQKNILKTVDLASDIVITVKHRYMNPVTDRVENSNVNVTMTVIPEIEAEYAGGYQQMANYLTENAIHRMSEKIRKEFQAALVVFTVDEEGKIVNPKISRTSGDSKTDKILLDAIHKMPKWKPAESPKGIKVKQEFEFSVGNGGC